MNISKTIEDGVIIYRNDKGQYHNNHGPAIIESESETWFKNGIIQRKWPGICL